MRFKQILVLSLLSAILSVVPILNAEISSARVPIVLWIWKFDAGVPYSAGTAIRTDLELMAMDTAMNTYDMTITAKIKNSTNGTIYMKNLGSQGPGYKKTVTLIDNVNNFPPGWYQVEIKGYCYILGKSETITRTFTIN